MSQAPSTVQTPGDANLVARRHLGRISLLAALAGVAATHLAIVLGAPAPTVMAVMAAGFEAALIGALADWFAVAALFRRIPTPLPFVTRHTDVIRRRRPYIVSGIRNMVETKWLTPDVIEAQLRRLSAALLVARFLGDAARRARVVVALRMLARSASEHLDSPGVVGALDALIRGQVAGIDIPRALGAWLRKQESRERLNDLIDALLSNVATALKEDEAREQVAEALRKAARAYASNGLLQKAAVWLAEATSALDYEAAADQLLQTACLRIRTMQRSANDPLRLVLMDRIREVADELATGSGPAYVAAKQLQARLLDGDASREWLGRLLGELKGMLQRELQEGRSVDAALDALLARLSERLEADDVLSGRVDAWFRGAVMELVREHHHLVGDMVEQKLNALDDDTLVTQIRDQVWDDLQYIRLNGAIVGFACGVTLSLAKMGTSLVVGGG